MDKSPLVMEEIDAGAEFLREPPLPTRESKAIAELYQRFPGRVPARDHGRVFARAAVTEVYIYPEFADRP